MRESRAQRGGSQAACKAKRIRLSDDAADAVGNIIRKLDQLCSGATKKWKGFIGFLNANFPRCGKW